MDPPYRASAFGQCWRSDIPLVGFDPLPSAQAGCSEAIDVYRIDRLAERNGGTPVNRGIVYPDGIRFGWDDEVVFDMADGMRIGYRPGPGWTGTMPASFYGTVAALTMAWRGLVPLHACAVELDGRAILIAGAAGAGKSTLTTGLIAAGARFVADDLVVVSVDASASVGGIKVMSGRPTIRLHPDTAARMETTRLEPVAGDPRGKWLAWPRCRSAGDALDMGAILLLEDGSPDERAPAIRLFAHVFRRRWIAALPMREKLLGDVLAIAATRSMRTYPPLANFDASTARQRADAAVGIIRRGS